MDNMRQPTGTRDVAALRALSEAEIDLRVTHEADAARMRLRHRNEAVQLAEKQRGEIAALIASEGKRP